MSGFSKSPGTITKVYRRPRDGYFLTVGPLGNWPVRVKEPNGETTLTITNHHYIKTQITTNIFSTMLKIIMSGRAHIWFFVMFWCLNTYPTLSVGVHAQCQKHQIEQIEMRRFHYQGFWYLNIRKTCLVFLTISHKPIQILCLLSCLINPVLPNFSVERKATTRHYRSRV